MVQDVTQEIGATAAVDSAEDMAARLATRRARSYSPGIYLPWNSYIISLLVVTFAFLLNS